MPVFSSPRTRLSGTILISAPQVESGEPRASAGMRHCQMSGPHTDTRVIGHNLPESNKLLVLVEKYLLVLLNLITQLLLQMLDRGVYFRH